MKHSQAVHDAMVKAFKELLSLSPRELSERLKKREIGVIGHAYHRYNSKVDSEPRAN